MGEKRPAVLSGSAEARKLHAPVERQILLDGLLQAERVAAAHGLERVGRPALHHEQQVQVGPPPFVGRSEVVGRVVYVSLQFRG